MLFLHIKLDGTPPAKFLIKFLETLDSNATLNLSFVFLIL